MPGKKRPGQDDNSPGAKTRGGGQQGQSTGKSGSGGKGKDKKKG